MIATTIDRSNVAAPLSSQQKQRLAILSREAYAKQPGLVRGLEGKQGPSPVLKFDRWRHAQAIKAVGRRISEATQGDYLPLKAHFLDLAGKPVAAMQAHMRRETEPQRVALHKLTRECAAKGLDLSYAAAICRRQFRCALEEASEKQLWCLFFTVRNRRNSGAPAAPAASATVEKRVAAIADPYASLKQSIGYVEDDNIPF